LYFSERRNNCTMLYQYLIQRNSEIGMIGSRPFLFDTTVAYNSLRRSKAGYKRVAKLHGFYESNVGCPVVIGDKGTFKISKTVNGRRFEVANEIVESTHIVAISHVKGHIQAVLVGQ